MPTGLAVFISKCLSAGTKITHHSLCFHWRF